MGKENSVNDRESKKSQFKRAHFKACPLCRSKSLIKFDMDFFCIDCDWNSILFDVYSGNFEKRIGLVNRNRSQARRELNNNGVILLEDLISLKNESIPAGEVAAPSQSHKEKTNETA